MYAPVNRRQGGSINWVLAIFLGAALPVAVAGVVGLMVRSTPSLPKIEAGAPAKTPAATAPAPNASPSVPVGQSNARVDAKPSDQPQALAEVKKPGASTETKQPTAAGKDRGQAIYTANCAVCHASGVAGAPKFGDKAAWAPRIKEGNAAMHRTAIKGIRAMPPKGGNASLSDEEVKAAVDYLIAAAK